MPHRVHLLLTPQASGSKLPGSPKAATAKRANLLLQRSGQPIWQDESYDRLVRDGDEFRRIQRYIEGNPVTRSNVPGPVPGGRPERPPQAVGLPHECRNSRGGQPERADPTPEAVAPLYPYLSGVGGLEADET
jgi:hypothetical protein